MDFYDITQLKFILEYRMEGYGHESYGFGFRPVVRSCEYGREPLDFIIVTISLPRGALDW